MTAQPEVEVVGEGLDLDLDLEIDHPTEEGTFSVTVREPGERLTKAEVSITPGGRALRPRSRGCRPGARWAVPPPSRDAPAGGRRPPARWAVTRARWPARSPRAVLLARAVRRLVLGRTGRSASGLPGGPVCSWFGSPQSQPGLLAPLRRLAGRRGGGRRRGRRPRGGTDRGRRGGGGGSVAVAWRARARRGGRG